jgi:HAD superfamily hydrolase (TIGR01450 family)
MRFVTSALRSSDEPLTALFDVALLDLDGVVYVGAGAVPGVPSALASARDAGMRLAFVTNNAARPPQVVAEHLTELGVPAEKGDVVTSSQAAARYLAERLPEHARVLVIGTVGLEEALRERGLVPVWSAEDDLQAVVQGFSPDLDWRMLAEGAVAINRGVPWIATNADPTVPSPRGPLPGNGSLVAALKVATRRSPVVTGKPDPTMHRESVLRSEAVRPIVVGDRLDTDIEGAEAVGCPSLLVMSGVTTARDLLAAPVGSRPTYVSATAAGLLTAHPAPRPVRNGFGCGAWLALPVDDHLVLSRDETIVPTANQSDAAAEADALDVLRALSAAAWAGDVAGNHGRTLSAKRPALAHRELKVVPDDHGSRSSTAAEMLERLELLE